ncbi:hypothetical protein AMS68_003142 [Peltaster fructicola]|uniref:PCI domain-containing protein n=1 Tax=Peltaster fructicola TaxID=286661 RepID=A0A6H0XSK9_9PEZI|nr:hypothetical protein AMS68_003142 [Peltaster fructicola]
MDQTTAQAALAPYLALAKSATAPRAAADLVVQATSAQGTYVFAELLAQKNIEKLKQDAQYTSHHKVLEIFSWGTWEDYRTTANLPKLSDAQTLKLRLLSLISYAAEKHGDLSYATLCERLDFESAVDLEHLITTAIYFNLLHATLDPQEQLVLITSVAPLRDLVPGSVQSMLADLEAWSNRCNGVLADLEGEIAKVKSNAAKQASQTAKTERQVKAAVDASEKTTSGGPAGPAPFGARNARTSFKREAAAGQDDDNDLDDAMDIDIQGGVSAHLPAHTM